MDKKVAKEVLKEYSQKYPNIKKVKIQYEGSGDSFNDFWDYQFEYMDNTVDVNEEEVKDELLRIFDGVIDTLFEEVGANFNNDGSEGTFTIDLKKLNLEMDCYEKYTETRYSGKSSYFAKK